MVAYEIIYGLVFVAVLVIKYFKGAEIDRRALMMMFIGAFVLIGGGLLALLVGLGSQVGAAILTALAATASGAFLMIGLWLELMASRTDAPERPVRPAPAPRPAASAPAPRPVARPPAPAVKRPAPRPHVEDDGGDEG